MTRKEFVPGIIFKFQRFLYRYEKSGTVDVISDVGIEDTLYPGSNRETVNLKVTDKTIQLYTGYGHGCMLMYGEKIAYSRIQMINPANLKLSGDGQSTDAVRA